MELEILAKFINSELSFFVKNLNILGKKIASCLATQPGTY